MACIKDINPASTHHYLILPKKHIRNAKELSAQDAELCEFFDAKIVLTSNASRVRSARTLRHVSDDRIVSTVEIILERQGLDRTATRTGFHWPPFNTVHHLHLHVISPTSNMSIIKRIMFEPNSYWFVSVRITRSYVSFVSLHSI